jgi:hypothetical protein
MVRDPQSGKYRRTRLFVLTLGYSRKSVRLLAWRSSARIWAELHEQAFRRLGGCPRVVVLDNLKEGVLVPDLYDPTVNPLFRDVLAHYGVVAPPFGLKIRIARGKSNRAHAENPAQRHTLREPGRSAGVSGSIAGSSAGPTRASMARPNARSRPCSLKKNRTYFLWLSKEDWGKLLGYSAAVTTMLDRLLHHGHILKCGPRSWRRINRLALAVASSDVLKSSQSNGKFPDQRIR